MKVKIDDNSPKMLCSNPTPSAMDIVTVIEMANFCSASFRTDQFTLKLVLIKLSD